MFFTNVYAQNNGSDTIIVLKKLEKMKKELNLSKDQVNLIKPILLDNYEKNQMFEKNIVVVKSVQDQNDQSTEYGLSKVFTPEQYNIFLQNKEKLIAQKRDLRIREKMAFYTQELKLGEQQAKDLKTLLEKSTRQKDDLKEKNKNNDELLNQEIKKFRTEFDQLLKNILSKDQLALYYNFQTLENPDDLINY